MESRVIIENLVLDVVKSENVILFNDFISSVVCDGSGVLPFSHGRVCVSVELQVGVHIAEKIRLRPDVNQVEDRFVLAFRARSERDDLKLFNFLEKNQRWQIAWKFFNPIFKYPGISQKIDPNPKKSRYPGIFR